MRQLRIMLLFTLFAVASVFAQVDYQGTYYAGELGSEVLYFYMSGMADSSETYYTNWYDISDYWGDNYYTNTWQAFIERSSANDTAEVYVIIEGRMGTDGTNANSDAYDVDTLGTYNLELDEWVNFDMNNWKPEQIRVQLEGTATNRIDALVRGWIVFERRNTSVQIPK